ncbi:MAG TPA: hypothetical protein VFX59_18265 [Polyangiales bacterium]|nr:hypothetical protein [Polyangiales bacterium]
MRPLFGMVTLAFVLASAHASAPGAPPAPQADPLASLVRSALEEPPLFGRVQERISAGSYTYLALRTERDELRWTVTMGRGEPEGTEVRVRRLGFSPSFYSKRLQRAFPNLVFGVVHTID